MADRFKEKQNKQFGPGGKNCPCCNHLRGKDKPILKRVSRARLKKEDMNMLDSEKIMTDGEIEALAEAEAIIRDVEAWEELGMRHASEYCEDEYQYAKDVVALLSK